MFLLTLQYHIGNSRQKVFEYKNIADLYSVRFRFNYKGPKGLNFYIHYCRYDLLQKHHSTTSKRKWRIVLTILVDLRLYIEDIEYSEFFVDF